MWAFQQSTGAILHDGITKFHGYAGGNKGANPEGVNNPDAQEQHDIGPLPVGSYTIGPPHQHPHLGPFVMNLEPNVSNTMFGRGDFRIHGDNSLLNQSASEGCIVLARKYREEIWNSGDHELVVFQ